MTEEDARTKWCPDAVFPIDSLRLTVGGNRHISGEIPQECKCIASDCMMWREYPYAVCGDGKKHYYDMSKQGGYCGLAGNE